MIKFFVVATGNYIFAIFWMWIWNQNFGFNYLIVRIVNIALAVAWNFLLYKEWVYKEYNPNTTNAYPNDTNIKNSNINSLR
jgi:putative flippase GtrA